MIDFHHSSSSTTRRVRPVASSARPDPSTIKQRADYVASEPGPNHSSDAKIAAVVHIDNVATYHLICSDNTCS